MKKYKNENTGEIVKTNKFNPEFYTSSNFEIIPKRFIEDITDWRQIKEPQYEIGKWYRDSVGLFCVTKVENDKVYAYGFCGEEWSDESSFPIRQYEEEDVLACEQEIETALINEAKKRGYKIGIEVGRTQLMLDEFGSPSAKIKVVIEDDNFNFDTIYNSLTIDGRVIFIKGVWATVVKDEVDYDKPYLSLNDILNAWENNEYLRNIDDYKQSPLFNNFKKAVEAKLNPKSKGILAQEHINNIETFCTEIKYSIKK